MEIITDAKVSDANSTNAELPRGQASPDVVSFEKIVSQSKETLRAETEAQVKRGRGRPPGTGKHQRAAAAAQPASEAPPAAASNTQNSPPPLPLNDMRPLLRDGLKTPFVVLAVRYDKKEIEIDDADADTPAFYLSNYFRAVFPSLESQDPKAFNLTAFIFSYLMVWLKKIPLFVEKRVVAKKPAATVTTTVEKIDPEQKPPAPVTTSPLPVANPVDAGAFFSRKN